MIRLEYDPPTNGVRISFILRDGIEAIPDIPSRFMDVEASNDGYFDLSSD